MKKVTEKLKAKKVIKDRFEKSCSVCGGKIKIILYKDRSYRGGHYFFKIPLVSKKEMAKALKFGTKETTLGKMKMKVLKKEPKPYSHMEYWECSDCYRDVQKN